jgi:hypothetical protein
MLMLKNVNNFFKYAVTLNNYFARVEQEISDNTKQTFVGIPMQDIFCYIILSRLTGNPCNVNPYP